MTGSAGANVANDGEDNDEAKPAGLTSRNPAATATVAADPDHLAPPHSSVTSLKNVHESGDDNTVSVQQTQLLSSSSSAAATNLHVTTCDGKTVIIDTRSGDVVAIISKEED